MSHDTNTQPRPVIVGYANGREDDFDSLDAALASLRADWPDMVYGHDGDLSDGGERTLVWAYAIDQEDDDGARAVASIRWEVQP